MGVFFNILYIGLSSSDLLPLLDDRTKDPSFISLIGWYKIKEVTLTSYLLRLSLTRGVCI